jgi:tetratricopeptide (TPR) repeat protein
VGLDDAGTVAEAASRVHVIAMPGGNLKLIRFKNPRLAMVQPIAVLAFLITTDAYAQWQYDPKQLPLLPEYCKYTQLYRRAVPGGNNRAEIARWSAVMGGEGNFNHMHHYCWALENTNRALYFERSKIERDRRLRASIPDFDYVIRNVKPDFAMLPEILTKKGENLIRLGQAPEGIRELHRAIDLNPGYWPPYAALSDHYREAGDSAAAREWLEKGLTAAPGTKALQRRLAELDTTKGRRKSSKE